MICFDADRDYSSKWNKWRRDHFHRYTNLKFSLVKFRENCGKFNEKYLQVLVDIESREMLEISSAVENISNVQKKRKKVRKKTGGSAGIVFTNDNKIIYRIHLAQ